MSTRIKQFAQDEIDTIITTLLTLSEKLQMAAYDLVYMGGDDHRQRIAVRLRYYKAVSPKHAVVSLEDDEWQSFLKADECERIHLVCRLINMENMASYIRELQWVPLKQRNYLMKY